MQMIEKYLLNKKTQSWLIFAFSFFVALGSAIGVSAFGFTLSPFRVFFILFCVYEIVITLYQIIKTKKIKIPKSKYLLFMIIWFFYALITVVWAKSLTFWVKNTFFLFLGFASVFIMVKHLKSKYDFKMALLGFEIGVAIQVLIGWIEVVTNTHPFVAGGGSQFGRVPIGTLYNPNDFATFMLMAIAVCLVLYLITENTKLKAAHSALAINCLALLILTNSRANLMGVIAFMACAVLSMKPSKQKTFILIICGLVALAFIVLFVLQLNIKLGEGNSDSVRISLIASGFILLLKSCFLGVGTGQVEYWLGNYNLGFYLYGYTNIHNWWVELLATYGVIIFVLYLLFYFSMIKFFLKGRNEKNETKANIAKIILCFLFGFIFACISSSSMISAEWFWVFFAFIIAYVVNSNTSNDFIIAYIVNSNNSNDAMNNIS